MDERSKVDVGCESLQHGERGFGIDLVQEDLLEDEAARIKGSSRLVASPTSAKTVGKSDSTNRWRFSISAKNADLTNRDAPSKCSNTAIHERK